MGPEHTLEAKCRAIAHEQGALFFKMNPSGIVGVPDRVLLMPGGKVYFMEFKAPFGRLSAVQRTIHAEFEKRGHRVLVIRTVQEFKHAFTR